MARVGKKPATSREELGKRAVVSVRLAGGLRFKAGDDVVEEESLPGRQARLVFACLLSEHARPVPRDELAEAIWVEAPPATWDKALVGIVSKLRTLLAESRVRDGILGDFRFDADGDLDPSPVTIFRVVRGPQQSSTHLPDFDGGVVDRVVSVPLALIRADASRTPKSHA